MATNCEVTLSQCTRLFCFFKFCTFILNPKPNETEEKIVKNKTKDSQIETQAVTSILFSQVSRADFLSSELRSNSDRAVARHHQLKLKGPPAPRDSFKPRGARGAGGTIGGENATLHFSRFSFLRKTLCCRFSNYEAARRFFPPLYNQSDLWLRCYVAIGGLKVFNLISCLRQLCMGEPMGGFL